jgi:hypothetical protein
MSANSVEPSFEGPRNAKAEAKAAKAYAKALRPWYKKKRVIVPAGFVALVVAVSSSNSDSASTTGAASENASLVSQSEKPAAQEKPAAEEKPEMTSGQQNAIESAESYLDGQAFSKRGLIAQLKFEDYSLADATFAVNHVDADWNAEAVESAESYLDGQSFSKSGLIEQLKFEKFTSAQAQYAADKVY